MSKLKIILVTIVIIIVLSGAFVAVGLNNIRQRSNAALQTIEANPLYATASPTG